MNMYDIIVKKKRGEELDEEQINFFVKGYTDSVIPDYQVSSLLMAICLKGMTPKETAILTKSIADSGDKIDLSHLGTLTVDKHSTGGVGDKTTLIVAPIVASLGAVVAKMSGRGLGHTGGTIDKLESIPGYRVSLTPEEFNSQIKKIGIAITGQSGNLAPADKKLYALRDVSATVDSLPLISSSIMGKKLASGSHSIVLDVKCGSGSFMKTPSDAIALARSMVDIGLRNGRKMSAIITDMDRPLGRYVGNALEVKEAAELLLGRGEEDLKEICLALASEMVRLSLSYSHEEAMNLCIRNLENGEAFQKFKEWIEEQGADPDFVQKPELIPHAPLCYEVKASMDGYITHMNTEAIGAAAVALGAGRILKEDSIDYGAGIELVRKTNDKVEKGETIAILYSSESKKLEEGVKIFIAAIEYGTTAPSASPIILARI